MKETMPVQSDYEANDICVLRMNGLVKQSEFVASQESLATKIERGNKPRILVVLDDFAGWERGVDWNDLDFLFSHSGEIVRIAIVGERRWEVLALAFAGAGVRRAPVKFFEPDELTQARAWLCE